MNVEINWTKDIPTKQINQFEDKVVYDVAVLTREFTKNDNAFPYLTGELMRNEIAEPITGSNKTYGLSAGVSYANRVYKLDKANWTNPATQPHWYYTEYNKHHMTILEDAISRALKEI